MPASLSSALSPPLWAPVLPASLCRPRKIEVPGGAPRSCRPCSLGPSPPPLPLEPRARSCGLAGLAPGTFKKFRLQNMSRRDLSAWAEALKSCRGATLHFKLNATAHMGRRPLHWQWRRLRLQLFLSAYKLVESGRSCLPLLYSTWHGFNLERAATLMAAELRPRQQQRSEMALRQQQSSEMVPRCCKVAIPHPPISGRLPCPSNRVAQ